MKIDIETIINKIILNLENEKIKNLLIFIIILITLVTIFNHDKDKYKIYSNEITKLIVIGIAFFFYLQKIKCWNIFYNDLFNFYYFKLQ